MKNDETRRQATGGDTRRKTSTVLKKLTPGAPGTLRLHERYGNALVCVRYREDARSGQRHTTVELIVDSRPAAGMPSASIGACRVGPSER